MKKTDAVIFIPMLSVSLLLRAAAAFFMFRFINWSLVPVDKTYQSFFLIAAGTILTPLYLADEFYLRAVISVFQLFTIVFISQALGTFIDIYFFLTISLVIDIVLVLPGKTGIIGMPAALYVIINALKAHRAGNQYISGIPPENSFLLIITGIFISGTVFALKSILQKYYFSQNEVKRMSGVIDRVTNTNLAYQNYIAIVEKSAVEKERQRITREIHDIIGYTMTNVYMLIQAAVNSKNMEQIQIILGKALNHVNESTNESRLALRRLREEDNPMRHGRNLFSEIAKTFSEITGVQVKIDFGNLPEKMNSQIEKTLFRMLEESMTNAFKHSPSDIVTVKFLFKNDNIMLWIFNAGSTMGPETEVKEGMGLKGMRERIDLLGGTFTARYVPGGFLLYAEIPEGNPDE